MFIIYMIRNKQDGKEYKVFEDNKGFYYIKNGKKKYLKRVKVTTKPKIIGSNVNQIKIKNSDNNKIQVV